MSEMSGAMQAYLEALSEAFESQVDPVQMLIGGVAFDVKSIEMGAKVALILDKSDVLISAKLQDGREITFLASRLEAFITGRSWE